MLIAKSVIIILNLIFKTYCITHVLIMEVESNSLCTDRYIHPSIDVLEFLAPMICEKETYRLQAF